jgi:hypothetical protein
MATNFKVLLQQRHLQTHSAFCREYDRIAKTIDPALMGGWPSRATLHRWMTGKVTRLPYPFHCRVLEGMFQGWTARELFQPCPEDGGGDNLTEAGTTQLMATVRHGLASRTSPVTTWPVAPRSPGRQDATTPAMPPPLSARIASENGDAALRLARGLLALQKKLRLTDGDTRQLAMLVGQVVDLSLVVAITVEPDGDAVVTYSCEIVNLSPAPLRRIPRQIWFERTRTPRLEITPIVIDGRHFVIQRTHDGSHISKFACQFSPAVEPGGFVRFGYSCAGGCALRKDHYWRQDITRPTRYTTITVHQRRAALLGCSAIEQLQDGSEILATDEILWDQQGHDLTITATRDYLGPGQALTLRWETDRGAAAP